MGYEIDFLPVGEGERSGDAITLRYGNLHGPRSEQVVIVIDGGFQDTGEDVVEHIREYYNTSIVDLVVSTHPDSDHINGLSVVLEELDVQELWMHKPSERSAKMERIEKSISNKQQKQAFRKTVQTARDLENQAEEQDIPVTEPFTGVIFDGGVIEVLGPTREFYEETLDEAAEEATLLQRFIAGARRAIKTLTETWTKETLTDDGETTANNNTSAILVFVYEDRRFLFTSDAGMPALNEVAAHLSAKGLDQGGVSRVQIPHHGSKRNVGPTVLNRMLGGVQQEGTSIGTAYVSVAPDADPKHPAKKVTNAFLRRGYPVHATQGNKLRHHYEAPARPGWSASEAFPLFNEVEE